MELNLEMLMTVAGAVVFIEVVLQLFYKPLVLNLDLGGWYDLITNIVAFLVALVGTLGAGYFTGGLDPTSMANLALVALAATATATLGYEVVTNVARGVRG